MAQRQSRDETMVQEGQSSTLKRRGLIAGAAGLVAGILAAKATEPVSAVNGDNLLIGNAATLGFQTGTAMTWLGASNGTGGAVPSNPTFRGTNAFAGTVDGKSDGIQGFTVGANTAGTFGRNNDLNGVGIWGEAPNGTGAFGDSGAGSGVAGSSTSGVGVFGQSTSGIGVQATSTSNVAVYGASTSNTGVFGVTSGANQYGVLGTTTAANSTGVAGIAQTAGSSAFSGGNTVAGGFAAIFQGTVQISGKLIVSDPSYKSGALAHPDGSHRLVFCVESPESWIEDFGKSTIANGQADVKLDPDFAAVVQTNTMLVYVTANDDHHLHVTNQTASGFTVKADTALAALKGQKTDDLAGSFTWRVVAKPKTTNKLERLPKYEFGKLNLNLPPAPKTPNAPKPRPEKP